MSARTAVVGELDWTIDPPEGWLVVPAAGTETPDVISAWEQEVTEALRVSFEQASEGSDLSEDERAHVLETVTASIANLRAQADGAAGAGERVVAAFGLPDRGPVPVVVAVGMSDPGTPDAALLEALGAKGGGAPLNPPTVEYLDLPDGDGVRVSRLDIGDDGGAWLSVGLGRRTEYPDAVVDTVILWRTQDLFAVPLMMEVLDELLPAITITRSES
ncbi:hypothetical protein APR04_000550 [Promicromonospora umidemergens]|uniref:ESAT-6 protein secretion system EspG family protein n=1 Tax=Promicromonospora umidemergens TaxID=629679 RepID=A0ABP8XBJ6_9MICO|nr:hypothetical protein [Promicromonospora umidemergens]MCP2281661.1 hypothetical protein [Promicromonospora umidemergens]